MGETSEKKEPLTIRDTLNQIIEGKVDANRRYIDEVLEKYKMQIIDITLKSWLLN